MSEYTEMRASLQVAPLNLHRSASDSSSHGCAETQPHNSHASGHWPFVCDFQPNTRLDMTPPATPNGSQEELVEEEPQAPPVFYNFLRAFYPFHPSYSMSDSSVTLPLNEGDVVLVHSIHTNGWADGTLLLTGARGWLPTNYCEAYDPEEMRNLLKALLNFWDLLRSTSVNDSEIFGNQEFMKGIIAGVRCLLVSFFITVPSLLCRLTSQLTRMPAGTDTLLDSRIAHHSAPRGPSPRKEIPTLRVVVVGQDGETTPRSAKRDAASCRGRQ